MLHQQNTQRLLWAWLAVALLVTPAGATAPRLHALGGGAFIEDDHNVHRWYGSLADFPNLLILQSGHFTLPEGYHDLSARRVSGPGIGLHLALDEGGHWGTAAIYLHDRHDDVDPGGLARDNQGSTVTAMWTRRWGAVQPTLMFRRAGDTPVKVYNPDTEYQLELNWDRSRTEYGLGLRWDISSNAYLDFAGEIRRHSEQLTAIGRIGTAYDPAGLSLPGPEHASTGSVGLRSRAFVRLGESTALVPLLEHIRDDRDLPPHLPTARRELTGNLTKVGLGLNWYPDADRFLVLSADYIRGESTETDTLPEDTPWPQETRDWGSFSVSMGIESRFTHWLAFRGSFRYEPVRLTANGDAQDLDFATFMINVGASLQAGPYDLDIALTDQEPRAMVGYGDHSLLNNPATWVSVSLRRTFW